MYIYDKIHITYMAQVISMHATDEDICRIQTIRDDLASKHVSCTMSAAIRFAIGHAASKINEERKVKK